MYHVCPTPVPTRRSSVLRVARLSAITWSCPGLRLSCAGDPDPALEARLVINAAGLGAQSIARMIPETPEGFVPPLHYAKGSYFDLAGRSPFSHLVYPLPSPGGLGVHLTIDMAGRARFGPDVQWVEEPDFHVDPARSAAFYDAIRCYWPALPDGALSPA